MSYKSAGFNGFLDRSIALNVQSNVKFDKLGDINASNSFNFDQMQVSGSLGDKMQIGGNNVVIDGKNRRIVVSDGNTNRILIGEGDF